MKTLKTFEEFHEESTNEKKKMNAGLQAYLDKKKGKGKDKDEKETKKEEKEETKKDEDDEKKSSGLTAKQKKLPPALQAAILKRMKK